MKRFSLLFGLALMVSLLAACGTASNTGNGTTQNQVMMGATTFEATTMTISKGQTITFTDDAATGTMHMLVIGKNGVADTENGAPDFGGEANGQSINPGQSWTTPPWNTPGTYYITCVVHPTTMTLTVTVTG